MCCQKLQWIIRRPLILLTTSIYYHLNYNKKGVENQNLFKPP